QRCRIREMMRPLVEDLRSRSRLNCTSVRHMVAPASAPIESAAAPSVCVITPDVTGEHEHADAGAAQNALAEVLASRGYKVTLLHTNHHFGTNRSPGFWTVHFAERNIEYVTMPPDLQARLQASEASVR